MEDIEKKIKTFVLKNKKILLMGALGIVMLLMLFFMYSFISMKYKSLTENVKIDYSNEIDKDNETHKKLLTMFSEDNEIEREDIKEKDTLELKLEDYITEDENSTEELKLGNHITENENSTIEKEEQKKGNDVGNNIKKHKNTRPIKTDVKKNNHISNKTSSDDVETSNKYSLSFGDSDDYASNTTSNVQKAAKLVVMESKKYKNNELIRLRFLDDFKNYKKNDNIYGRITFSDNRAKIYIENDKSLYLYSKDGLEGIKIGVSIKDLTAKNKAKTSSIDAVGNMINSSVRSVNPALGLLTQASNTAISTGRIYMEDNEILINIDEGTYLYVK